MAVDDRILIREITHVVAVHKQAAGKIVGLLKSPMQIIVVVFALYDRVRNIQRPDPQPADDITVHREQLSKIYRVLQYRKRLFLSVFEHRTHLLAGYTLQSIVIFQIVNIFTFLFLIYSIAVLQIVILIRTLFVFFIKSI